MKDSIITLTMDIKARVKAAVKNAMPEYVTVA